MTEPLQDMWSEWLLKRRFVGYAMTPVTDIAQNLGALYQQIQPLDTDPSTDFDERNLVAQVLTREESETFTNHMRPLVEGRQGTRRMAVAYLWAIK